MVSHWIKDSSGKEWAIRFSQSVSMQLAVQEEIPANKIQDFLAGFASWPIGRVYKFYRLAFKSGAKKEGKKFDMNDEEFVEWLSDDESVMQQILKVMTASKPDPQKKTKGKAK